MTTWIGDNSTPFTEYGMTDDKMKLLDSLSETSDYWKAARNFISQAKDMKTSALSPKQLDWIESICASLESELNRKDSKEAFADSLPHVSVNDIWKGIRRS